MAGQVFLLRREPGYYRADDLSGCGYLGFSLCYLWLYELDSDFFQARNVLLDYWMIVEWFVHRRGDEDRDLGADGRGSHGGDGCVIYS